MDVPASEHERGKLLAVFPEEIWSLILKNVDNINDFYGIRDASHLFQDVLSEHRIRILFPCVFKILVKQCASQHREKLAGVTEDDDNDNFEKWIGFTDLLPLRQICRSWKKGIDDFLQNAVFKYEFPNEYMSIDGQVYDEIDDYYTRAFEFISADDFTGFRDYFDATHLENGKVNPFPTRKVDIIPPDEVDRDELDRFYHKLVCFLQEYGTHIWYFTMDGKTILDSDELLRIYNNLGLFLKLVPNMKILWILAEYDILSGKVENEVLERYQQTCFRRLQNLERIDQLGMSVSSFTELTRTSFPKLQHLGMTVITKYDVTAFLRNSCPNPNSINILKLDIHYVKVSWEAVFDAVKKQYGETLEQLRVILARPRDADFALTKRISLPKLKVLYLEVQIPVPLDFLLGVAGTLEKLNLNFREAGNRQFERAQKKENVVKFYSYLNDLDKSLPCTLHKSNIWIVFPKLQSLNVWNDFERKEKPSWSCTRKDWEQRNTKNMESKNK